VGLLNLFSNKQTAIQPAIISHAVKENRWFLLQNRILIRFNQSRYFAK